MWVAIVIAVYFLAIAGAGLYGAVKRNRATLSLKLTAKQHALEREQRKWQERVEADKLAIAELARTKALGFPLLASAYADYFQLQDVRTADSLEYKDHPAPKAAAAIREAAQKRHKAEKLWRVLRYKLEYYESLFPWLIDFTGDDLDDIIRQVMDAQTKEEEPLVDPVSKWVTDAEFRTLTTTEKNQRALDRYLSRRKTRWEIGRDYERYVGHVFDVDGWNVNFHGIVEGLADLGRDLIASKRDRVMIVQCKCWSKEKQIHEKHVFQLFGTVEAFKMDNGVASVQGLLVTSTRLSERAKLFSERLGITYWENHPLAPYPVIKCNVSHLDGTRIYHLPFDQQYDRTTIDRTRGECYVATVAEAETLGFRRAWRWHGMGDSESAEVARGAATT